MSNVSSVVNYFATANEGFNTTLGSTISSGATTVPLAATTGLTNGTVFVGIIEPGVTNQQVFTGTVDTGGSQITGVVWTRGTNVGHATGVTIVDYVTGTIINMITAGILKEHTQTGTHTNLHTDTLNASGNGIISGTLTTGPTTVTQSGTGVDAKVLAAGVDTNVNLDLTPKGTGRVVVNGAGAPQAATVATSQTTTSTSYTDLSTAGPAVTAVIGASGIAMVIFSATMANNTGSSVSSVSFVASGANTISAGTYGLGNTFAANFSFTSSRAVTLTGLTAGSTTFTLKYEVNGGTGTFASREISVIPL